MTKTVGDATGQKWVGWIDDTLFGLMNVSGGYKTAQEVGLELGKKALTQFVSSKIGNASEWAQGAAEKALKSAGTAANVAAQAGISVASSYASSVTSSAINSFNIVDGELKFDSKNFTKSLYSSSTIGGALGAGLSAGLSEYNLGTRKVDALDKDGNIIKDETTGKPVKINEYTKAQGFNSTQIENIGKFNSLMGGLASSAVSFAIDGQATFNLLNISDFGVKSNTGLFELTVGKKGVSSRIGTGGTNISMGNLMASLNGAKATVKNTQINNAVNKNYEGNKNVANMLRAQYGFGDKVQQAQLDSILKGNTELVFGNTTDGQAQTVDENGKRIVHMNMDQNGDWKMGAIMLGHESYRDGIVSSTDAQLEETRKAVKGHTEMTVKMMNDKLYMTSMMDLIGSNQNLQNDLIVSLFGSENSFNSYVDGTYDSSADYWLIHNNGSVSWDGNLNLYVEKDIYDKDGNLIINKKLMADENGNGIIRESPDEAVNYRQLQDLIDNANGNTVNISGINVKVERLKEIAKANEYIVSESKNIFGNYTSYAAEALLSDGYMSYDEALKSEQELLTRYLNGYGSTNLVEHWSTRYVLNRNDEFRTIFNNQDTVDNWTKSKDRIDVENGHEVIMNNKNGVDGIAQLLDLDKSVFHGENCFKWCFDDGRELVFNIGENGKYQFDLNYSTLGTYNYHNPGKNTLDLDSIQHAQLDLLPYVMWGNNPDDFYGIKSKNLPATPRSRRIHPKFENYLIESRKFEEDFAYLRYGNLIENYKKGYLNESNK
ncbi:MAG: hypothetical protein K5907_06715 [Treponema sp.]|nr:hypothetical protein [Treponema sp.]